MGKPCAELVDEVGPQLAPLRLAPLCLVLPVQFAGFCAYITLKSIIASPGGMWRTEWKQILAFASASIECAALALALVVGPLRISAALADFIELLSKVRHNAPRLHGQVQAVELMEGFGTGQKD